MQLGTAALYFGGGHACLLGGGRLRPTGTLGGQACLNCKRPSYDVIRLTKILGFAGLGWALGGWALDVLLVMDSLGWSARASWHTRQGRVFHLAHTCLMAFEHLPPLLLPAARRTRFGAKR